MRERIDASWIRSIDGRLTFCGALEEYYDEIAKRWLAESTRSQYDRIYNELLLPNLQGHNDKSIDQYTLEDYYETIQSIIDHGQPSKSGQHTPYADSTVQKFRYLLDVVVFAAAAHGDCSYVFWGSCFSIPEDLTRDQLLKERIKLKKSLTIPEEHAVADYLLSTPAQRGQEMGLLLMYALGLRNNEACGANYGDIRRLSDDSDIMVLLVYKSTVTGSNIVKASGKTRNADRILPIPAVFEAFITARREYLEQTITFPISDEITCVDDLPLTCVDHYYATRCSSAQLTAAGKEMFHKIKMDGAKLAFIDLVLSDKNASNELYEKDPSAYLLRRNWGTHLTALGLTESEIEYLMGHDILDAYEARNEFVNDTRLLAMKKKLDQRPILNTFATGVQEKVLTSNELLCWSGSGSQAYQMELHNDTLRVSINAKEPCDPLHVKVICEEVNEALQVQSTPYLSTHDSDRTLDVISKYHELYQKR